METPVKCPHCQAPLPEVGALTRAAELLEQYAHSMRDPCTSSTEGFGCEDCPNDGGSATCLAEVEEVERTAKALRSPLDANFTGDKK